MIDLLVVTHRHWDHISGFSQAADVFQQMTINRLWMSWAEDPQDVLAAPLWKKNNQALAALGRAVNGAGEAAGLAHVARLLDFVGDLGVAGGDPMAPVRQLVTKDGRQPEYRQPGEGPLPLPTAGRATGVPGARLYVLGPPRDLKALGQMNPTASGHETYLTTVGLTSQIAFLLGVLDPQTLSTEDAALRDLSYPFERDLRIPREEAAQSDFFRANYGFGDEAAPATAATGQAWRRIDEDWLGSAEELALQLDNCINNTSMPLAIELAGSNKVLLFVGDAQVGNWLSWHDLSWTDPGDGSTVTAGDLLARTAFYKVGHHGSHNATIRALNAAPWGLELMCRPDLVAMIPVNEAFAHAAPRHWQMPWPATYGRLEELTAGRVMRIDSGIPPDKPDGVDEEKWQAFTENVQVTALYVEFTVGG